MECVDIETEIKRICAEGRIKLLRIFDEDGSERLYARPSDESDVEAATILDAWLKVEMAEGDRGVRALRPDNRLIATYPAFFVLAWGLFNVARLA